MRRGKLSRRNSQLLRDARVAPQDASPELLHDASRQETDTRRAERAAAAEAEAAVRMQSIRRGKVARRESQARRSQVLEAAVAGTPRTKAAAEAAAARVQALQRLSLIHI